MYTFGHLYSGFLPCYFDEDFELPDQEKESMERPQIMMAGEIDRACIHYRAIKKFSG